ncbi:MAG: tRNA (guanosine(46)-N7)-methyltransferase TrmB [Thermoanaerobaculum sp.]
MSAARTAYAPPSAEALVLALDEIPLPLRAEAIFGRPCPLELELGVGKGRFAIAWAQAHPEVGVLGVERARKYLELSALRAARAGVANLRLAHTTAEDLLFRCLPEASVSAVHVYFPDPWPKKRHHKRRLFKPENVARLAEVMEPGALLRVKTDYGDYAAVIAEVVDKNGHFTAEDAEQAFADIPLTHFEIKYQAQGRQVFRFAWRRR